jgi:hypothetical protein
MVVACFKVLSWNLYRWTSETLQKTSVSISNIPVKILKQAPPLYKLEASPVESTCALMYAVMFTDVTHSQFLIV